MARVCVGIGTNVDRVNMVRRSIQALKSAFGELQISRVVETSPWGFEGDDFYNLVVSFDSSQPAVQIKRILTQIEHAEGGDKRSSMPRKLDLDLLLVGEQLLEQDGICLPRTDVLKYPFVLSPLAEIAGDMLHPVVGQSLQQLWQDFDKTGLEMKTVDIKL